MKDQIRKDYITAMKARDREKADSLKMVIAAMKQVEIDTREELTDKQVEQILRSELKKRKDAIEQYEAAGRKDLVDHEVYDANIIEAYLPELMSREEVESEVSKIIEGLDDTSNFGMVMGKAMGVLKGKADGKLVQEVVKSKLG